MRRWILLVSLGLLPGLGAWIKWKEPAKSSREVSVQTESKLLGMWSRFQPEKEGDPQRFWYFHTGGIGLFRYGRMGLTYTQTFGYQVKKNRIVMTFNKSGARHAVAFTLEGRTLTLLEDPKMGGRQTYTRRPAAGSMPEDGAFDHPFARLWTESTTDKKGNSGFRMYQLQAPTIDGRGVGWYHEGDFTEWSTETLHYRRTGPKLSLYFPVRNERHVTTLAEGEDKGVRTLAFASDPRNYWHPRVYRDGGPGFTMRVAKAPLPYHVPGHGAVGGHGCPAK